MIHVIAAISVKEGKVEEFLKIFKANIPAVLQEDGCVEYVPTVDIPANLPPQSLNALEVTILEKWTSVEALHAHLASPHMRAYQEKVASLVTGMNLKVLTQA